MLLPPPLRDGATVHVCQPAGPIAPDVLDRGMDQLRALGFHVRHDASIGGAAGYLAAPDDRRAADLEAALRDPDVDAIVFARGGYGAMRLLERMPEDLLRDHPKRLVGCSDITALHAWAQRQGVISLHGPMIAGLGRSPDRVTLRDLNAALRAERPSPLPALKTHRPGVGAGRLVGGNLALIAALIGTRWLPDLRDCVLFLEDVGEAPYRLDRMVTTLRLDRRADGLRGVILGDFTRCPSGTASADAQRFVADLLDDLDIPIATGLQAGHDEPNRTLFLGARGVLHVDATTATWTYDDTFVDTSNRDGGRGARASARSPASIRPRAGLAGPLALLRDALDDGTFCGAQLEVSRGRDVLERVAVGVTAVTPDAVRVPVTPDTRFDLASLTKPIATATLAALALQEARVGLDERIPAAYSTLRPTLVDLLRHTSGLPAWLPIHDDARRDAQPRAFAQSRFARAARAHPTGTPVYSDVGYIALGRWLERIFGIRLDEAFRRRVAAPLGLPSLGYRDADATVDAPARFAATEWCPWRQRTLQGVVHDENAQVLGGAAGHAGLFGTAGDVGAFARNLLGFGASPPLVPPRILQRMWNPEWKVDGGSHVLGWDTPSAERPSCGTFFSRTHTFGHLGFTGTSVWMDRSRGVVVVLLTNRVHPTRERIAIRALRPILHDAVMRWIGEKPAVGGAG